MRKRKVRFMPSVSRTSKQRKNAVRSIGSFIPSIGRKDFDVGSDRVSGRIPPSGKAVKRKQLGDSSENEAGNISFGNSENAQVDRVLEAAQGLLSTDAEGSELPFSQSYFRAREGNRFSKKSGKKISDIELVDEQELRAALSKLIPKQEKEVAALLDLYRAFYPKWNFQLRCGFSLIMYGFGSKKALLEDFASTLMDGAAIVVNGYLPTVNIKQVVLNIAAILWEHPKSSKQTSSKLSQARGDGPGSTHSLEELMPFLNDKEKECHVYLVVHNIDGPSLRDNEVQQVLADVAASSQVRLLASIDHINAPILWDNCMASTRFNWWWHHTPTYAAYTHESMHLPPILAPTGAAKSLKSAILVLQSLTPNARSVFCTLAEYQLAHTEEQGLSIHKLYTLCREHFLVSSELTLRSHLTEFRDHELICSKRGMDGQDCLYIPLPLDSLTKLVKDVNDS